MDLPIRPTGTASRSTTAAEFGILVDMILLSLALADRINILRMEHAQAQRTAIEWEHKMAQTLQHTNEELEQKVKERTAELLEAKNAAEQLARTDPMTGMSNRLAFNEQAAREFAHARRYNRPLSVVLFDLDRFKRINDQYGHPTGDAVIQSATRITQQSIRATDMVGRLGGEEFAILLPNTTRAESRCNAERLREAIARLSVNCNGRTIRYTASFGITELTTSDKDFDTMMQRADALLYQSKHAGRNCLTDG